MNLPLTLVGISKVVREINKPYRDQRQIDVAQRLFEWWWVRPNVQKYTPRWESCTPDIQAFWMDGAHRVLSGVPLITVTEPDTGQRRIAARSDRRAPYKHLVGYASARGLQVIADQEIGNTKPVNISREKTPTYVFPIFTEDPE